MEKFPQQRFLFFNKTIQIGKKKKKIGNYNYFFLKKSKMNDPHPISFLVLSSNKHFERFFYEFILGNLVYLYLLIMISRRYIKNREIADLPKKKLAQSIKNKIFLISLLIVLNVIMIFASFYWPQFWLYDIKEYSFLYIFQILVLILQTMMMDFEFMKTIPYTWYLHHLFWILLTILHLLYLLNTIFIQCEDLEWECLTPNLIFDVLRLGLSGLLTLYNLVFKFQDLPNFEMIWNSNSKTIINQSNPTFESLSKPLLPEEDRERERKPKRAVKFKVNIKNKLINNNNRVYYQINIELNPQKSVKIFKTIDDFIKLDQTIQETKASLLLSGDNPPLPKLNFQKPTAHTVFSSEFFLDQKGLFENYLRVFLENELFPPALIDFLEIKEPEKTKCIQSFHRKFILNQKSPQSFDAPIEEEKEEFNRRSVSVSSVVLTENNASPNENLFRPPGNEKDADFVKKRFCMYFNVQMQEWTKERKQDYYSFVFQLSLVEKPEEMWKITKRYSDFIRLDQELKKFLKRSLPELPEKKLLLDSDILNKRGKKLAKYLRTLLNERIYFNNILFEFIKLNNENYEILMNTQSDLEAKLYQAFVIDHTVMINNEDKQPYTGYVIKIVKYMDLMERRIEHQHQVIKRFSDFERLHKILSLRFEKIKNFPSLPSKLPSFSAGETINYRKMALEKYLNELFKIENIEDSVGFRKFLNVDGKEKGNFIMNVSNLENEENLGNSPKDYL